MRPYDITKEIITQNDTSFEEIHMVDLFRPLLLIW